MYAGAPWNHGVSQWGHTLMPCVCKCVAPAGFASGRGYLVSGAPIWSGRSPADMMPVFIGLFFLLFSFSLGFP